MKIFITALCQTVPYQWLPEAEQIAVYIAKIKQKILLLVL